MKYANLHLHSTYSDAGFTPTQLVRIGKALGYKALALTDHETDGGNRALAKACASEGLDFMTGVEFYGKHDGALLHLTALDFDPDEPTLRAFIKNRCELKKEACRKRVEYAIEIGQLQGVTWQDVLDRTPEGAWLCINSVLNAVNQMHIELPEGEEGLRTKAFKAPEMKQFKPPKPSAEEVIRVVRKAGGIIALAHPNANFAKHIESLVDMGLNGIEVGHPNIAAEVLPLAYEAAGKYNLYHCGGTDHDGPMSCVGGKRAWPTFEGVTEEEFFAIKNRTRG